MAKYIGPKSKIARKFNDPIFGPDKVLAKKNYPPGMHGRGRRKKLSEYAVQLAEKQKAKYTYGLLEKQFANLFKKASHKSGITGTNLLQLLESRLDNTVFRLGIAPTRSAARQIVLHKHITVNGEVVNIPSLTLKVGDVVAVREKSKSMESIGLSLSRKSVNKYPWLQWDTSSMSGTMTVLPTRDEIPENFKEQLIVELYSK